MTSRLSGLLPLLVTVALLGLHSTRAEGPDTVTLAVDVQNERHVINPLLYGAFFEGPQAETTTRVDSFWSED